MLELTVSLFLFWASPILESYTLIHWFRLGVSVLKSPKHRINVGLLTCLSVASMESFQLKFRLLTFPARIPKHMYPLMPHQYL